MPVNARRHRKHRFSPRVRKIPLEKEITTQGSNLHLLGLLHGQWANATGEAP